MSSIQLATNHQCCSAAEVPYISWPAHIAKNMADSIHRQVMETLRQSRLVRNVDGIHLVRRNDIVSVEKILGAGAFSQVSSVVASDGRRYAFKHLKSKLMADRSVN